MRVDHEVLLKLLHYDPNTGVFTWLSSNRGHTVGDVAGSPNGKGYLHISIDRKQYPAQILAWFYVTGTWPCGFVDHKNRIVTDNRWDNLREATVKQNSSNRGLSKQNKSGYKGVREEKNGKFMARITIDGKSTHLGTFATAAKAAEAYDSAALTHFGEFALTNKTLRSNHGYEH